MEAALAKTEMREKVAIVGRNSIATIVGGVLGLAGAVILLMAFVQALSAFMDARGVSPLVYSWLSPLIVSVVVFAVSYYLIKKGMGAIKAGNLMPEHTAQSLRETGEWIKEKVS
jgi:hypothetical protein